MIPDEERDLLKTWVTAHGFSKALGVSLEEARERLISYRDAGLIRIYDNGLTALKFRLKDAA